MKLKYLNLGILIIAIVGINFISGCTDNETRPSETSTSTLGDQGKPKDCGDVKECFEEKFRECKPAIITITLVEGLTYYYEILDPKDGLCEVKSKFIANPNPEWVDKEMICKYDNSKDFEVAIQNMINCDGELYELMTNPQKGRETTSHNTTIEQRSSSSDVEIDISIVNETTDHGLNIKDIEFKLNYIGKPFKVYMIQGYNYGPDNPVGGSVSTYYFNEINHETSFNYFPKNDPGVSLNTEGDYTFYFYVYECAVIEQKFGEKCVEVPKEDVMEEVEPFKSIKNVLTYESEISPECESSKDCTELCEGCIEGKQVCEVGKKVCIECIFDAMCEKEYKCDDHKCVKR